MERQTALVRAARNLGAPVRARRAAVIGADALRGIVEDTLAPSTISTELEPTSEAIGFDLIVMVDHTEVGTVAEAADRLKTAASALQPDGVLVLAISTLGTPSVGEGARPYDSLLFPEAAAAGKLGAKAALSTPLAMSTWMLLVAAVGLQLVNSAGIGDHDPPVWLEQGHAARLAVFDTVELRTGQMILLLRKHAGLA